MLLEWEWIFENVARIIQWKKSRSFLPCCSASKNWPGRKGQNFVSSGISVFWIRAFSIWRYCFQYRQAFLWLHRENVSMCGFVTSFSSVEQDHSVRGFFWHYGRVATRRADISFAIPNSFKPASKFSYHDNPLSCDRVATENSLDHLGRAAYAA